MVSADEKHKIAIIPGVILGKDAHAFIQVLDGSSGSVYYHNFKFSEFTADNGNFAVKIGDNHFDEAHLLVAIDSPEGSLAGEIRFSKLQQWPVSLFSPGVMGWYAWVPKMECYHGVLSFDHTIEGQIILNGRRMDFTGGRGYIEKDWGKSFPSAWVWMQSNHFRGASACITASVANIPWLGKSFRGFIIGLLLEDKLFRFATFTGAKIETLEILDDHVDWVIRDRKHRIHLFAKRAKGGLLRGPTQIDMGKRVLETLNAEITVKLETVSGDKIFEGRGLHSGLEVMGDLPVLLEG